MSRAEAMARRLATGERIAEPVAVVVAHPDDETLWAGALLARLDRGLVIHLTDGAPADMADAGRLGFASRDAYAAARSAELDAALTRLGCRAERRCYAIVDQACGDDLPGLTARLAGDLAGMTTVVTHPYEGGHPDHDSAAWAVAAAVRRLGARAPAAVEFAAYHLSAGERQMGAFWPDERSPEHVRALAPAEIARVDAALDAHASQAAVFGDWRPRHERWRAAPAYDFAAPPPPGAALYDGFGWAVTSAGWREAAARC